MRKPAPVEYEVLEAIRERWSPYAYDAEKSVEPEKLLSALEAARWAASASNEQPWAFIVGDRDRSPETYQKIYEVLIPFNQSWTKSVPVLILVLSRLQSERTSNPLPTAQYDTGMAVENFVLQAVTLGLHVHQMAGYDRDKAREVFAIPETFAPNAVIALGYDASSETLDNEMLRGRHDSTERLRNPLSAFVFSGDGAFGEPSPLVAPK